MELPGGVLRLDDPTLRIGIPVEELTDVFEWQQQVKPLYAHTHLSI
jgi:hypothetical protein